MGTIASYSRRVILHRNFSLSSLARDGNCMLKVDPVSTDNAAKIAQEAERRGTLVSTISHRGLREFFAEQLEILVPEQNVPADYKLEYGDVLLVGEGKHFDDVVVWTLVSLC
jgi:hypothetical protein